MKPLSLFGEMAEILNVYTNRESFATDLNYWLTWDVLQRFIQPKAEDSGSLLKRRESHIFEWDKPRKPTKLCKEEQRRRKRISGWIQKVHKGSHIIYSGEKSPDFDKRMSGNDFPDSQPFKSSLADLKSVEFLDSDISLLELEPDQGRHLAQTSSKSPDLSEFEPNPSQGLHLAKTLRKSPDIVNSNIDIEN